MKTKIMTLVTVGVLAGLVSACSSAPVARTKWSDKNMRIMIDPDSIDEENYVQIQTALVQSGKFTVVDRARGMKALKKEQEVSLRKEEDRYADKEKWSHWGKMYGVGSIVIAHVNCTKDFSVFNRTQQFLKCRQYLSMVDSNTGEVFLAVEGKNDGPASYDLNYIVPDWNDTVAKMIDSYPEYYRRENYTKEVTTYQDISAEHAQRQREAASLNGGK